MFNIGPVELLVIACLLGATAVVLARRKGLRWPGAYFVPGVLFPFLSLVVIAAKPSRPRVSRATGAGRPSSR